MFRNDRRLARIFHVVLIWFFVLTLQPVVASGDDVLNGLIVDYRAYGLPEPSDHAALSLLKWSTGTMNRVPQYRQVLALVETAEQDEAKHHWVGCKKIVLGQRISVTSVEPTGIILGRTEPMDSSDGEAGFPAFPDLALAVQCGLRGWDDLGIALLERSRTRVATNNRSTRGVASSDQARLATLAWNYWCNEFCTEKGDRQKIITALSRLHQGPHALGSNRHANILDDMRKTLLPANSDPGSIDDLIDQLMDVGTKGNWQGRGIGGLNSVSWYDSYRKLQQLGLDAVPSLLEHSHDFRMTRCIERDSRGTWHVRVADIVRELLNALVEEEFAYDFLIREGRGKCVDRAHVLHWWTRTQEMQAKDYLIANALTEKADGTVAAREAILHVLGQKYPDDLVKLYVQNVERLDYPHALFEAIGTSKASSGIKANTFLEAMKIKSPLARNAAVRELLKMNHSQAVPLLINEFRAIPETPDKPYWLSNAGRFASLICYTGDARAWDSLVENAKRVDIGQRLQMIQTVGGISDPKKNDNVIRFLSAFLDDRETRVLKDLKVVADPEQAVLNDSFSGPSAGFTFEKLSVRNFAAMNLASVLELRAAPDASWKDTNWASLRFKVKDAIARRTK